MAVPKIYAANVQDVGKPIASAKRKASKESDPVTVPESGDTPSETPKETKPKRVRKKADPKVSEPIPETPKETPQSPISLDEKVKAPRKRIKKSIEAKSDSTETLSTLIDEALSESFPSQKEKKVSFKSSTPPPSVEDKTEKMIVDDTQPPQWFKSYIQGVREEEALLSATKVSKKVTKALAHDEATAKWKEPVTRERVNKSVDTHMQKMYATIFPNRRF
jgi:hypothetical protein